MDNKTKKKVFYYISSLRCSRSEENVTYAYAVFQVGPIFVDPILRNQIQYNSRNPSAGCNELSLIIV